MLIQPPVSTLWVEMVWNGSKLVQMGLNGSKYVQTSPKKGQTGPNKPEMVEKLSKMLENCQEIFRISINFNFLTCLFGLKSRANPSKCS